MRSNHLAILAVALGVALLAFTFTGVMSIGRSTPVASAEVHHGHDGDGDAGGHHGGRGG